MHFCCGHTASFVLIVQIVLYARFIIPYIFQWTCTVGNYETDFSFKLNPSGSTKNIRSTYTNLIYIFFYIFQVREDSEWALQVQKQEKTDYAVFFWNFTPPVESKSFFNIQIKLKLMYLPTLPIYPSIYISTCPHNALKSTWSLSPFIDLLWPLNGFFFLTQQNVDIFYAQARQFS